MAEKRGIIMPAMASSLHPLRIFSGSSHPALAKAIAQLLHVDLAAIELKRFANGEVYARPLETVRGDDVFLVQTATRNVNEDLMELFVMLDALKRSFSNKVHVVMPHYAYSRQDRVNQPREPISAKLVADLISAAGADHLIALTLHSDQEQGFFNFPVDNVSARKLFVDYFLKKNLSNVVVVAPDIGGSKEAKRFAVALGVRLAVLYKTRPTHNVAEISHVVGDVSGANCILYDDMVDTGGTVVSAVKALRKAGAKDLYLAATHALFSDPAPKRLRTLKLKEAVVTDSLPLAKAQRFPGLRILSVAPLLTEIIRRVHEEKSVTGALGE